MKPSQLQDSHFTKQNSNSYEENYALAVQSLREIDSISEMASARDTAADIEIEIDKSQTAAKER